MSDEMNIDEKTYISSKRASSLSDYAQDYIGQLCRAGLLDARRVGGLWFVTLESIENHKTNAEQQKVAQALALSKSQTKETKEQDSFVALDGKSYISAHQAAQISGYTQDYIGQLARTAKINSRQVGNRWYVEKDSLLTHKHEKDSLLAAVQTVAVGIPEPVRREAAPTVSEPLLKYFDDTKDLIPEIVDAENKDRHRKEVSEPDISNDRAINSIQIKKDFGQQNTPTHTLVIRPQRAPAIRSQVVPWTKTLSLLGASALTIVIVVSLGFESVRSGAQYAAVATSTPENRVADFVSNLIEPVLVSIENFVAPEISYSRK
jgi:hypothetical protein